MVSFCLTNNNDSASYILKELGHAEKLKDVSIDELLNCELWLNTDYILDAWE